MKLQDRLATIVRPESRGGLLLCGMNWGGSPKDASGDEVGWADFFADDNTNRDKYQPRIKQWFREWGFALAPNGKPTTLDLSISQTNLFLDQSPSFRDLARTLESWGEAMNVLADTIYTLDIRAVIIFSTTIASDIGWYLARCEAKTWRRVMGDTLQWSEKQHGRLKLRFAQGTLIPVANTCHPRFSPTADNLLSSRRDMEPWLAAYLSNYGKQAARTTPRTVP